MQIKKNCDLLSGRVITAALGGGKKREFCRFEYNFHLGGIGKKEKLCIFCEQNFWLYFRGLEIVGFFFGSSPPICMPNHVPVWGRQLLEEQEKVLQLLPSWHILNFLSCVCFF